MKTLEYPNTFSYSAPFLNTVGVIFNAFSDKSVLVRGIDKKLAQLRQDGGGTLEIGIPDDNDEALLAGEHHYAEET